MAKHTQIIRQQKSKDCLSVFDHFVGLALNPNHLGGGGNFTPLPPPILLVFP